MEEQQMSNDEAQLDLLWYIADAFWYFVGSDEESFEDAQNSLERAQGIALAISESMDLRVEDVLGEREFLVRVKLSDDPHEYIKKNFFGS